MQVIEPTGDFQPLGNDVLNLFFLVNVLEFTGSGVIKDPISLVVIDEVVLHVGAPIVHL